MAQTQENTTEDKNTFIEASPVNDKAVKRLLRQKKPLTGTQVGRILFLNVCELTEGKEQLYNYKEYLEMTNLLYKSGSDKEIRDFILYQRLTTYAVNAINELIVRDKLSLKGFEYIYSQLDLYKIKSTINSKLIIDTINDVRVNLQYINSYALFFDAMKKLLKDRRLISEYRITTRSKEVIKQAKKFDNFIMNTSVDEYIDFHPDNPHSYDARMTREKKCHELGLYPIGEIPRVYTEHQARKETIKALADYLLKWFDPDLASMDNLTTATITKYINQRFPRD